MNNEIAKEMIDNLIKELDKLSKERKGQEPINLIFNWGGRKFAFYELQEKYYKYTPEPITPQSKK